MMRQMKEKKKGLESFDHDISLFFYATQFGNVICTHGDDAIITVAVVCLILH